MKDKKTILLLLVGILLGVTIMGGVVCFAVSKVKLVDKTYAAKVNNSNEETQEATKEVPVYEYYESNIKESKKETTTPKTNSTVNKNTKTNTSKIINKSNKEAKLAKLDYKVLSYDKQENLSLVEVNLYTGRHHQIRVQLANIGHSLYGDQKYGTTGKNKQIALWAYKLTIVHPTTKEEMTFTDYPEKIGIWKNFELEF